MMPDDYIENHIEIETPHLRETAMTRYEQCWDMLQTQMFNQSKTIHGGGWPTLVLERMRDIEEMICGPIEEEVGNEFAIDIWTEGPEDVEAYKEGGALGCSDQSHYFPTLREAWMFWTTPMNVFHMQLTHYPNFKTDEWGDGNILAEGTSDDYYAMLTTGTTETIKLNKIRDHAENGGMDIDDAWIVMDIINGEDEEE